MLDLKTIDQNGIKTLLCERLQHPAEYSDRPLIIWRADFRDGIQEGIIRECFRDYNKMKGDDDKKWFISTLIGDEYQTRCDFTETDIIESDMMHHLGMYVIEPVFAPMDYNGNPASLARYHQIINSRRDGDIAMQPDVPVVAFMCYAYDWFETPEAYPKAEQYLFAPDFEQWAQSAQRNFPYLVEFLRGRDERNPGLYTWYNSFNNQNASERKGCDYPSRWFDGIRRLMLECECGQLQKFSDIEESEWNLSFNGISSDLVAEFRSFIISRDL